MKTAKDFSFGAILLLFGICLAGFFFIYFKVKETKGQTLEELEQNLIRH